ncbi:MAG: carboxyl transferase domain-containing protein [Lachnospiraceae bacterium]|nr:carboxyl transferase domain-containing protein [Lachnospiraceae bacterium]
MNMKSNSSARMRIAGLLDEGSFVEIGADVTARSTSFNLQAKKAPSDGVITGYGTIHCKPVYVYSQDAGILGGTIGEMHAEKIVKLYELALKTGAPVIGMIDCAGLRLQESVDALNAFGRIYACQIRAGGVIPQITGIFGNCGGGLSIVPGLTDFTFMESEHAQLFVNSPNTLLCREAEEIATAEFQARKAGNVDGTGTQEQILTQIRTLIELLPSNCKDTPVEECMDDLNRICENLGDAADDAALVLTAVADNNRFMEIGTGYAPEMTVGFLRLNGATVGAVANRAAAFDQDGNVEMLFDKKLSSEGCSKAAGFIRFCDAFNIPVLTLTNTDGLRADKHQEMNLPQYMAEMARAYGSASVPMVNVIIGQAFGSAYTVMNSRALGADLVFAWPESSIGMMNAESAVRIIYADEIRESKNARELIHEKADEYEELQSGARAAASRGYVDAIIEPSETRKHIIAAFEMLYTKRGTFR